MPEPDYGDEAEQNAAAAGIQLGPQHFDSVRNVIDSVPSPDSGPSIINMLKSTAHSILNLMEAGHGDRPVDIADTTNVTSALGLGAGRFYPVNSLGVFGSNFAGKTTGPLAAKLNAGLEAAHSFISTHPDLTEAEKDTAMQRFAGFSKDYNDNWNFELDDSKADLAPITGHDLAAYEAIPKRDRYDFYNRLNDPHQDDPVKLPEILNHPDLYEAFPYLKNVNVEPINNESFTGFYRHGTKTIGLDFNQPAEDLMNTILHETQHAVNAHESDVGLKKSLGESANTGHIQSSLNKLYDIYDRVSSKGLLTEEQGSAINDVLKRLNTTHAAYEANPGEVEARNTAFRRYMSEEERKTYAPADTEDLARRFQLDFEDFRTLHAKAQQQGLFK